MKTPIAILKLTEYYSQLNKEIIKYENVKNNPEMNCDLIFADEAINGLKETQQFVDNELKLLIKLNQ